VNFSLPLFPESASSFSGDVDALYFFLVLVTIVFTLLVSGLVVAFAVKYRRRSEMEVGRPTAGGLKLEIAWMVIPFLITMVMFVWGARIYVEMRRPPDHATEIFVVGKQWMWLVQHLSGQREMNELHLPVNRPVKLVMASEDTIHSFFVPAFRAKMDVLPGRYTTLWFTPTKTGTFRIFCAEYCGTKHSGMIGSIYVMEPGQFQEWLAGAGAEGSLAGTGQALFQQLSCNNCHQVGDGPPGRGPTLRGLFGRPVELAGGGRVKADEAYLRESILTPDAKIVAGYQPIMPAFQGLVTEEQVLSIIEYIKSIGPSADSAESVPNTGASPTEPRP
jgi:cytochrome c oxidase subunit II